MSDKTTGAAWPGHDVGEPWFTAAFFTNEEQLIMPWARHGHRVRRAVRRVLGVGAALLMIALASVMWIAGAHADTVPFNGTAPNGDAVTVADDPNGTNYISPTFGDAVNGFTTPAPTSSPSVSLGVEAQPPNWYGSPNAGPYGSGGGNALYYDCVGACSANFAIGTDALYFLWANTGDSTFAQVLTLYDANGGVIYTANSANAPFSDMLTIEDTTQDIASLSLVIDSTGDANLDGNAGGFAFQTFSVPLDDPVSATPLPPAGIMFASALAMLLGFYWVNGKRRITT